jgi:uncharacterized protein involved in exopolysaccharide biosynthesis
MTTESIDLYDAIPHRVHNLRQMASVCFRYRRLIAFTFCVVFGLSILYVCVTPRTYEAETEILVKRERPDPVVTPDNTASPILTTDVSEEDLNSEVEILKSRDLLEKVVIACGLEHEPPHSVISMLKQRVVSSVMQKLGTSSGKDRAVPLAVRRLENKLNIDAIRKTNMVRVTYDSPDPELAAFVLRTLTNLYLEKHLEVHRAPGTFAFFQQQSTNYWTGLQAAEKKLTDFNRSQNTVSAQTEKSAGELRLVDFEASLRQTRTAIAATEGRLQMLNTEMASTPNRLSTQIKTSSLMLQQLKVTLLNLELKQTDMAGKYAPNYVPLRDLESQITETKAAIAKEEAEPVHDDTTDENPTHQWITDEIAKAKTDLESLRMQAAATEQQINAYRSDLLALDRKDSEQQDLIRVAKLQESNYLLYQSKREEARIADALDERHISNVSVAEAAVTPALPSDLSPLLVLVLAVISGTSLGLGLAFLAERFSLALQSPEDIKALLELPVLAAFPREISG